MAVIPPDLLQAVSADGGGQLAVVIGAGCSFESPTEVPLARALAVDVQTKLERDGVFAAGSFKHAGNLAALTSFVYALKGSQKDIVTRFPTHKFRDAKPNTGYRVLVALLAERAVTYVLSLNFDLAIQHAAAELGVVLDVVSGPGQPVPGRVTLVHLHGNILSDPEDLVLREETMDAAWRGSWQEVVAHQILSAPSVLFAGLGSAAPVLSESIEMIGKAIGNEKAIFQADVGNHAENFFAQQLGIPLERYVKGGWSEVLQDLATRVRSDQVDRLRERGLAVHTGNGVAAEDITAFERLVDRLNSSSLLALGKIRAYAALDKKATYLPRSNQGDDLLAEPILALTKVCRALDMSVEPASSGVWVLSKDGIRVGTVLLASGGGARRLAALEHNISFICGCIGESPIEQPDFVLIGGTVPTPADLGLSDIVGDVAANDLITGPGGPVLIEASDAQLMHRVQERFHAA